MISIASAMIIWFIIMIYLNLKPYEIREKRPYIQSYVRLKLSKTEKAFQELNKAMNEYITVINSIEPQNKGE